MFCYFLNKLLRTCIGNLDYKYCTTPTRDFKDAGTKFK